MSEERQRPEDGRTATRAERLAEALRTNLRRRKAQGRARAAGERPEERDASHRDGSGDDPQQG